MEELRYALKHGLSVEEVEAEVAAFFRELGEDEELQRALQGRGIDVEQARRQRQYLSVGTGGAGLTPEAVALIVAFLAPVASGILKDLWKEFILPRIRRKHGQDSIEPRG